MLYEVITRCATSLSESRFTSSRCINSSVRWKTAHSRSVNDSWNSSTKSADLQQVVSLSEEVIANHPLAGNYQDLWYYTEPDGDNEFLPELILSASFSRDPALDTYNGSHIYYTARYDDMPMMKRDLTGMRPYVITSYSIHYTKLYDMAEFL